MTEHSEEKMLTPEERAEKICKAHDCEDEWCKKAIAAEIRAAVEEAERRCAGGSHVMTCRQKISYWSDKYEAAKAEAYEDAAKIAEAEIASWKKVKNFDRYSQCYFIAECIRARLGDSNA